MELFAVHVADILLLHGGRCRRVGGVELSIGGRFLGADGIVLSIGTDHDGPQQVRAVNIHPRIPQDAQGLLVGVAVLVVHTTGDDAHLGQDGVQEDVARAGAGAVVAHLQNICLQVGTAVHKVALRIRFHIAGEQKAGGAVVHPQNDGGIVGVVILRHRAQHGHSGAAQRPDRARSGHFHLQALLPGVLNEVLKALGGGFRHGAVHMVCREIGQRSGQAAHMILVGVGAEHILQLLHTEILQVRDDIAAIVHVAAVVEHILAVTFHQHAQGLPHIQEVHLEVGGLAVSGRLGSADRRGAAARHHRRGITGGKAKGQRRRQGQSGNAPPEAYFFFFEVFHTVFSFC